MRTNPPNPDEIEITIFGPGYGECVVCHLGNNHWIAIDSCINADTGKQAALEYFEKIGIIPNEAVDLIVISHWHDDHIKGLSDLIMNCTEATICVSSALTNEEFIARALDYNNLMTDNISSGVCEIIKICALLGDRRVLNAIANRRILSLANQGQVDHCIVTTLSPSDKAFQLFIQNISKLVPSQKITKSRIPYLTPNHTAIALWIEIGNNKILLGSDVEENGDPDTGWSAIVQSQERPNGLAKIFKIPHHGSYTGHHEQVWLNMINESPVSIVSPFYRGGIILPTDRDIRRIVKRSPESYITTKNLSQSKSKKKYPAPVERTIKETVRKIRTVEPLMGWVSLRNGGNTNPTFWDIKMSPSASKLADLIDN